MYENEEYISRTTKSRELHKRAKRVLPMGVTYGLRFFDPYPFYTVWAKGAKLYDVDGNEYIDFWLGHLSQILGHSPDVVMKEVAKQIWRGTQIGTCHELEIKLAEQVVKMVPSAEMVRFTNSGTEANMYAVRLARTYTKRKIIVKFEGGWHGGYDSLHIAVKYPFNIPESAGLPEEVLMNTRVARFNDVESVEKILKNEEVAAVVLEPVLGAGGAIPAELEFLKALRELCTDYGSLLIFDEVITGFRLAPGGAQQFYGVYPDITVMGKILGGGFPAGGFAASKEIMEFLDSIIHSRPEYSFHGGTFCGNPITMTAGLVMLRQLENGNIIKRLNELGGWLRKEIKDVFESFGINAQITGVSSLFHIHFTSGEVKNAEDAAKADKNKILKLHQYLMTKGFFFMPAHIGGLCSEHRKEDLEALVSEIENYAPKLKD